MIWMPSSMAALNCSFSVASRSQSWSSARLASADSSRAICSPWKSLICDYGWNAGCLTWSWHPSLKKNRPGLRLEPQAESMGTLSLEDSASSSSGKLVEVPKNAADIVREFYDRINQRDVLGVASLFTEDCVYEDFNFAEPATGREAVLKFFKKVMSSFGEQLTFIIDDITEDDPNAVGVIWHLDWRGKSFPFSKGCSFYRCEVNSIGQRQIKYARDIVEPASRPGDIAMVGLKLVTSLLERFPQLADRL